LAKTFIGWIFQPSLEHALYALVALSMRSMRSIHALDTPYAPHALDTLQPRISFPFMRSNLGLLLTVEDAYMKIRGPPIEASPKGEINTFLNEIY
jgi:hypothetical protein